MPANPAPLATPHLRALIATGGMVVLLALFGWLGYWYGNQPTSDEASLNDTPTNTSSTPTGTTISEAASKVVVGKITKVLGESIEIATSIDGAAKTVTAAVAKKTSLRKLDLRTIPKNGIGDGTAMQYAELKIGDSVVVTAADTSTSKITATKVSKVIYP